MLLYSYNSAYGGFEMEIKTERWKRFCEMYSRELTPMLVTYEKMRKKTASYVMALEVLNVFLGCIAVVTVLLQFFSKEAYAALFPAFFVSFFLLMFLGPFIKSRKKNFKTTLKKAFMRKILSVFGDIKYESCANNENELITMFKGNEYVPPSERPQKNISNISSDDLINSKLFSSYNIRKDDDLFNGTYNGVDFRLVETALYHRSNSGKKQSVTKVFKGVIAMFTSNKNFSGMTMIATKGDTTGKLIPPWIFALFMTPLIISASMAVITEPLNLASYIAVFIVILSIVAYCYSKKQENLDIVKLEDTELNKHFNVYSTDQVESRYLLTPSFITRFKKLKTAFGTEKIKCAFFNNKIVFAISAKEDFFEVGDLYTSMNDPKAIFKLYNEITAIEDMIDHFKLDEKIGL